MRLTRGFGMVLALTLGVPRVSFAEAPVAANDDEEPASAEPRNERAVIHVVVVGSGDELSSLREAVAAWRFGDVDLVWQSAPSFEPRSLFDATDAPTRIRCFIDLSRGNAVRLYFANETTQRFMVRTIQTSGRLDEMDREALAQAIELSLLSLLEDRAAGLSRQDTESLLRANDEPQPETEPGPEPEPISGPTSVVALPFDRWELGASYGVVQPFRDPPPTHGPGVLLAHVVAGDPRALVFVRGQYRFPANWSSPLAGVELQASALRLGAEVAPKLFAWEAAAVQRLALWFAAGVDVVQVEPKGGDARVAATLTRHRQRIDPVLSLGVESLTMLDLGLTLRAGLWLEYLPDQVSYEVEVDGTRQVLFQALPVRPGATLGVGVALP